MPRIAMVRERRDKTWYDTHSLEQGGRKNFFRDDCRPGEDIFMTNMMMRGQMSSDQTYVCLGIGMRLIGEPREQEELLLDHLHVNFIVGDRPMWDGIGPHLSMLTMTTHKLPQLDDGEPEATEGEWKKADKHTPAVDARRVCYLFARPIIIPVRQNMSVDVKASDWLPRAVIARVHLFGLQTRDVQ